MHNETYYIIFINFFVFCGICPNIYGRGIPCRCKFVACTFLTPYLNKINRNFSINNLRKIKTIRNFVASNLNKQYNYENQNIFSTTAIGDSRVQLLKKRDSSTRRLWVQ